MNTYVFLVEGTALRTRRRSHPRKICRTIFIEADNPSEATIAFNAIITRTSFIDLIIDVDEPFTTSLIEAYDENCEPINIFPPKPL